MEVGRCRAEANAKVIRIRRALRQWGEREQEGSAERQQPEVANTANPKGTLVARPDWEK